MTVSRDGCDVIHATSCMIFMTSHGGEICDVASSVVGSLCECLRQVKIGFDSDSWEYREVLLSIEGHESIRLV